MLLHFLSVIAVNWGVIYILTFWVLLSYIFLKIRHIATRWDGGGKSGIDTLDIVFSLKIFPWRRRWQSLYLFQSFYAIINKIYVNVWHVVAFFECNCCQLRCHPYLDFLSVVVIYIFGNQAYSYLLGWRGKSGIDTLDIVFSLKIFLGSSLT